MSNGVPVDPQLVDRICRRAYELVADVMARHKGMAPTGMTRTSPDKQRVVVHVPPRFDDGTAQPQPFGSFLLIAGLHAMDDEGVEVTEELIQAVRERVCDAELMAFMVSCGYFDKRRRLTEDGKAFLNRQERAQGLRRLVDDMSLGDLDSE